jgi:hypothetical protein
LPKGVAVFARNAIELNRIRPGIQLHIGAVPESKNGYLKTGNLI